MRLLPAPSGVAATGRPSVTARASPNGFPSDYSAVVRDSQEASRLAMRDGLRLLEVEFPVASLTAVQGDEEGANEMTKSSEYLRQYARAFLEVASSTRVFFPDLKESELQANGVWADFPSINLDYLTKPSGLLDIGIDLSALSGYSPTSKIKPDERVFLAAYPSFDPRELVAVDKVWRHIEKDDEKTLVIFNAELCRLRSDYFPSLFYPEMARLSKELIPAIETVYYVHNFKGAGGGVLFRAYPGPWQVFLRLQDGETLLVHEQDTRPSLREVSLDIIPNAIRDFQRRNNT